MPACFNASAFCLRIAAKAATAAPWAASELAAAIADKYQLYLLCKIGRVFNIVRGDGAAAERQIWENVSRRLSVIVFVSIPPMERPAMAR